MSASTKLRRTLALALAGGSLAIGVPAALAATGGDGASAPPSTAAPALIQDEQDQSRPARDDCPEKDGARGGGDGSDSSQGSSTEAPAV